MARLGFLYAMSPLALTVVAVIGALTAVMAATIGVAQNDFKKVLAYSTVSQLGYMFVGVGVGAYSAGIFHVSHTPSSRRALPRIGCGHSRTAQRAGHPQDGRTAQGHAGDVLDVRRGDLGACRVHRSRVSSARTRSCGRRSRARTKSGVAPKVLWALLVCGAFLTAFYMWRLVRWSS